MLCDTRYLKRVPGEGLTKKVNLACKQKAAINAIEQDAILDKRGDSENALISVNNTKPSTMKIKPPTNRKRET